MSIKQLTYHSITKVVFSILLGLFISTPVCFAGGALTIVQDERQLAPRGSYIPERRVRQILKKVRKHKSMINKKETTKGNKQSPEKKVDKAKSPERN